MAGCARTGAFVLLGWDMPDLLGWRRHVKVCTFQLNVPGPSCGNPSGRLGGACSANPESKHAKYRAEHHLAWNGPGNDVKT